MHLIAQERNCGSDGNSQNADADFDAKTGTDKVTMINDGGQQETDCAAWPGVDGGTISGSALAKGRCERKRDRKASKWLM